MKEIRNAIKKYGDSQLSGNPTDWFKGLDQAEAEIKKIFLEWVGEDFDIEDNYSPHNWSYSDGYNQAKAEIRGKINES